MKMTASNSKQKAAGPLYATQIASMDASNHRTEILDRKKKKVSVLNTYRLLVDIIP